MKKLFGVLFFSFALVAFLTGTAMAQAKAVEWKMISTWTPASRAVAITESG